jgi:hypothetical protein
MLLLYSMVYPGANFNHALHCTPFTLASQLMSAHVTTIGEHHLSPMLTAEASIMPLNDPVAKVSRLSLHVAQVSHMKTILMLLTPSLSPSHLFAPHCTLLLHALHHISCMQPFFDVSDPPLTSTSHCMSLDPPAPSHTLPDPIAITGEIHGCHFLCCLFESTCMMKDPFMSFIDSYIPSSYIPSLPTCQVQSP